MANIIASHAIARGSIPRIRKFVSVSFKKESSLSVFCSCGPSEPNYPTNVYDGPPFKCTHHVCPYVHCSDKCSCYGEYPRGKCLEVLVFVDRKKRQYIATNFAQRASNVLFSKRYTAEESFNVSPCSTRHAHAMSWLCSRFPQIEILIIHW